MDLADVGSAAPWVTYAYGGRSRRSTSIGTIGVGSAMPRRYNASSAMRTRQSLDFGASVACLYVIGSLLTRRRSRSHNRATGSGMPCFPVECAGAVVTKYRPKDGPTTETELAALVLAVSHHCSCQVDENGVIIEPKCPSTQMIADQIATKRLVGMRRLAPRLRAGEFGLKPG